MRDSLNKRTFRQLKEEFGKYFIIFLFFVLMIGGVSGFVVAGDSLIDSYDESFEKYNVEDGNLEFALEPEDSLLKDIEESNDITLYKNYYKDEETSDFDSTLRIYGERNEIDKLDLIEGDFPSADDEIAIDRLYAQNHDLKSGCELNITGKTLKVSGIVAFTDYSCLYEKPSDMMFDNDSFGVGTMTDNGFGSISENHIHYNYSWKYDTPPADDTEAQDMAEDMIGDISKRAVMQNFIPAYSNQAIKFAGSDMKGDRTSVIVFLCISMLILAFIFVVTTESTIAKESCVIGTLRASGYTRGEIIWHYMKLPVITLFVGALAGNVLGYTLLEKYMASAYLMSYSLTKYKVLFNANAFVLTTAMPMVIMILINFIALAAKMNLSPLKFLRRDLSRRKKKKAFRLNTKIPIMTRFRLRIFFQNISGYLVIIFGVLFGYAILFFGQMFGPMLDNFKNDVTENMIADYTYVLRMPVESKYQNAEKGALASLKTLGGKYKAEEVSIYGVSTDSSFVKLAGSGGVTVSTAYMHKYGLETGDTITLKEKYGDKEYDMKIAGSFDQPASIAVYMELDRFNEMFDNDEGYFNIYFSNSKIEDIDEKLILTKITVDDMTKTSRQLERSMGSLMSVFQLFGVLMFVMVIYLLAKLIIEKNTQSISMTKILGYYNNEINGLYIHTTTIVSLLAMAATLPLVDRLIAGVFKIVFMNYSGYFEYSTDPMVMIKCFVIGVISYSLIAFVMNFKVKHIDLAEALKNVE